MKPLVPTVIILWLAAISLGMVGLWNDQSTAGHTQAQLAPWPAEAQVPHTGSGLTLVMFVHPHCPCTRASMRELAWVMARCQGQVAAHVLFLHPAGAPEGWVHTDLWDGFARIPGVEVRMDDGGAEARRFGADISGQVMLYDAQRKPLFSGGITPGRGHGGDNAGREAVVLLAAGKKAPQTQTAAFGCLLFTPAQPLQNPPAASAKQGNH